MPVGALVVSGSGEVLGGGWNLREAEGDPTAHAEVVAIRAAAASLGTWRLEGCTLVVTMEPCPMCAGAVVLARVARVVLGAWDPKLGACGSVWDVVRDRRSTTAPRSSAASSRPSAASLCGASSTGTAELPENRLMRRGVGRAPPG